VSLRILFADDSMTAQNMGKKILSDAGYDVVAVSNGAAAVKKIAEQKPDIIILDVYMPGYSGLEVCEKVRGSLDTLKTPVLLTVGKLEPYKPEDANRVKADGVIIKPFEASDLLAIVKKFEERIGQAPPPPIVEQTVRLEREYQEEAIAAVEPPIEHHSTGKTGMQPMVEVPDHMASSSAFSDLLGGDPPSSTQHFAVNTPAAAFETSVIVPAPPVPVAEFEPAAAWKEEEHAVAAATVPVEPVTELVATAVSETPEVVAPELQVPAPVMEPVVPEPEASVAAVAEPAHTHPHFIPVFREPEPQTAAYEVEPTAAPPTGEMEIPREPELQETAEETTRSTVADHVEPGLLSTIGQQMETSVATSPEPAIEKPPVESVSAPLPAVEATPEVSDSDFEARVAAAMAAYSHATESAPPRLSVNENRIPVPAEPEPVLSAPAVEAAAAPPSMPEPTPFEYYPPVRVPEPPAPAAEVAPAPVEVAAEPAPAPAPVPPPAPEPATVEEAVTASVEAAAAAVAAESGNDAENIAQAVHRVMERLKPELVEEIMRELKSKK
jgi:CheY-like chemotaxis protein